MSLSLDVEFLCTVPKTSFVGTSLTVLCWFRGRFSNPENLEFVVQYILGSQLEREPLW